MYTQNIILQPGKCKRPEKISRLSYVIPVLIIVITGLSSCKKQLDIGSPIDKITTEVAFNSDQSATSAVLGVYSQMMLTTPYIMSGGSTIWSGLVSDELAFTGTTANTLAFNSNTISPSSSTLSTDFWQRGYFHIYHINTSLEALNRSAAVSPVVKDQLKGELLFLRSYIYFYLINFFGDVPYSTTSDYTVNAVMPRTPVATIYNNIITDLSTARSLLPASWPAAGKARPNVYAATALLARVYLYTQQWQQAENMSTEVIASSGASLVSNLNNVFLSNSTEALWQLAPVVQGFNTTEGLNFIPANTTTKPLYVLTTALFNAFETGDQRKTAWTKTNVITGQNYNYPNKYKVRMNATVTEYYMMLRLSEQYLIRAEARAQQDKIAPAQSDINIIRSRAGLTATTANTKAALLTAIEKERRIELFAEWAHRWFDLKRTGRVDAVLQPLKPSWQSYAALFPIPQSQLERNPTLTQNPGY
jgi:starch-binding outer membrane protein, SusD/RagB family